VSIGEKEVNQLDEKDVVRGFIYMAKEGLCNKDDLLDKIDMANENLKRLGDVTSELRDAHEQMIAACEAQDAETSVSLVEKYGSEEEILSKYKEYGKEYSFWMDMLHELEQLLNEKKNFDKALCFSNIRELLRQHPEVKIGQIEKEAGVRLGYMSRLEKEGNTSEPSIEFIVSAAKLLKVSVDTIISVNLTGLTPTEQYIVNFFDKLKADTLADRLEWNKETPFNLNRLEADYNGVIYHPLFSQETFFEESETEYSNEVTRIVFTSKSFGHGTHIAGDCFNLRLKNGTTLYLMDIEKSVHRVNDPTSFAKEAWVYVPGKGGSSLLVATQDKTPVAPLLEELFSVVKDRMEHPQINNDVMYAIDSYMKDDVTDDQDEDDGLPFH